jgi:hypothetical protein
MTMMSPFCKVRWLVVWWGIALISPEATTGMPNASLEPMSNSARWMAIATAHSL